MTHTNDHAVMRQGVRAALEARPEFAVVGEAESGAEVVRRAGEVVSDVVLMDLLMEGHVSNILSKLHLADRTQAAVYAWREGVVRK